MRIYFKKEYYYLLNDLNQRLQYLPCVASPFQVAFHLVLCHVASVYLHLFSAMYQREEFACLGMSMEGSHIKVIHTLCVCKCAYICIYAGYFLIYIKYLDQNE